LTYAGAKGPKVHEVEPLSLVLHRSALYLLARHVGDARVYTFAVDRIAGVDASKNGFRYPGHDEFDPAAHYEGAFGVFVPPSKKRKPTDVELIFDNERWLKLYVSERRWHPTQEISELKDGRLRMRFRVDDMIEVWPWIRSFGEAVKVVKPKGAE
jgi:predicted DNA-binding transcriptional regulator YafY